MNPNYTGLAAAGLSIVAFAVVYRSFRKRPARIKVAALLGFGLLAIPPALYTADHLHVLPEWAWFYNLRSLRGSEFLVVFSGCAAGAAASLLPRIALPLAVAALFLVAVFPYLKQFIAPLDENSLVERWNGNACLQSAASTCGPASVCTILKNLGANVSEREAAHSSFTYAGGTEAWYLARYVRSKGFSARFVMGKTFSPSAGLPAVVGVRLGAVGHFIAVLDVSNGQVTFADPVGGERQLPISQFEKLYQFTGFQMVITKK